MNTIYNKYLSSVAGICFDTPGKTEGQKTPQQLAAEERAKIDVTQNNKSEEKNEKELEAEKTKADEEAKAKIDAEAAEKAKQDEEAKKKVSGGEEGAEETELDASENDPEKLKKTIERLQKRVDKLTGKVKLTETEKNELATKLSQIQEGKEALLTEEDVEKRSEQKANEKVAQREFVAACNRLADAAEKVDKNFPKKVSAMAEEIGPIPGQLIGILDDLDDGGKILSYLADNVEEAEDIYKLSPAKMALQITKISSKLTKEEAEKAKIEKEKSKKDISKVPDHKEPPGGSSKTDNILRDDEPMEDWIKKRNQQAAERRKMKLGT